jgi:hypothetical protein
VLSPRSYETGAVLVSDAQGKAVATLPDGLGRAAFEVWIRELPDSNSPAWLGLPVTAEAALQSSTGHRALHKLAVLQGVAGDEDESGAVASSSSSSSSTSTSSSGSSASPASSSPGSGAALQRGLLTAAERWLALLPAASTFAGAADSSVLVSRSSDSGASAVERALARELLHASAALALVSADARALQQYGTGAAKATNTVRELAAAVTRGTPPATWAALFTAAPDQATSVEAWVADFAARLAALKALAPLLDRPAGAAAAELAKARVWVGGLLHPETFVQATRQHVAQVCSHDTASPSFSFSLSLVCVTCAFHSLSLFSHLNNKQTDRPRSVRWRN